VRWKQLNLDKLSPEFRKRLVDQLADALARGGAPLKG